MVLIAGERSGVGKTTVTLALLAALNRRGLNVQSFKVGPDYIDPMFHSQITGRPCRNLDVVLTSESYVQQCFTQHSQTAEYALIEGVMGLFDGASGRSDFGSSAHIAKLLDLSVILVLNCASTSRSIAAIAHGYQTFDPKLNLAGIVLNRVGSDRHLELLTQALEPLGIPIIGVLRRQEQIVIPDRHLGLVPANELSGLNQIIQQLADLGETCFDWQKLMPLLTVKSQKVKLAEQLIPIQNKVKIAIAYDQAFNFYYQDNLDLLASLGAELFYWSPIRDFDLPQDIDGIYFGGGFPEVFAEQLSQNRSIRNAIKAAIETDIPVYAECGGLMYLCKEIVDFNQNNFPMVGIFATQAIMGNKLTLGYRQAMAIEQSFLVNKCDRLIGHEFHRSSLSISAVQPLFQLHSFDSQISLATEGWQYRQVHASYTHLHFGAQPELALRFVQSCQNYRNNQVSALETSLPSSI
jgi:cobyrinic acid a,c-diamide synthase